MEMLTSLVRRLRALIHRGRVEQGLDAELRFHIEMEIDKRMGSGLSRAEARRQALRDFGGVEVAKEAHRDARGTRWLEDLVADTRFALRSLRHHPVLAGAAILTLALGIGANTAIFSVINAVILRPLPYPRAEQLAKLSEDNPEKGWVRQLAAPANYLDWKERVRAFADVAAYTPGGGNTLSAPGLEPRVARVRSVTGNYFSVLGIAPERGRPPRDEDTWKQRSAALVISHRLWRDAFGGDSAAIGRTITMDGAPTRIIGVMPASFTFAADSVDAWRTMDWDLAIRGQVFFRRAHYVNVIARLRDGVSPAAADADFQVVVRQLQREYPETNRTMGADLVPLQEFLIGDVKLPLLMLQAAVGLLLLIACANVSNLMLVRALGRERETALRLTLGAGRERLVRQAMTESLVLSAFGGGAGFLVGWWGTRVLTALQPRGMLPVHDVPMDLAVPAAVLFATSFTALLFGIAPALWTARRQPADVLKEGGRGSSGHRVRLLGDALVAFEVALALVLAVGAGLLVRSFWRLTQVDPGLDPSRVVAIGINLPAGYDSSSQQLTFFEQLRERVQALPDVAGATIGITAPNGFGYSSDFHVAGRAPEDYGSEVGHDYVSSNYFAMLGIPLIRGRAFTAADQSPTARVVVINASLARRFFAGQDPVGQRLTFDKHPDSSSVWRTIVGVIGDVHNVGLSRDPQIEIYEPFGQQANSYMTLIVRARGDSTGLVNAVRGQVRSLDARLALSDVTWVGSAFARSIARPRFLMTLLLAFAATGFVLAVIGVYGVMAQLARRRTREMGIRIALGAGLRGVEWLVVRHGLAVAAVGLLAGTVVAAGATGAIRALLFGVAPTDPLTFVSAPLLLVLTAAAASWVPARRASHTDPMTALREE